MAVFYRCKRCGGAHTPPVSFAEKLYFDESATLELEFECPETAQRGRYNKTDLFWREPKTVEA